MRAEMNLSPAKPLTVILAKGSQADQTQLDKNRNTLCKLANLASVNWYSAQQDLPLGITSYIDELEILIPLSEHADAADELRRLEREINKLNTASENLKKKLSNKNFLAKAPQDVISKETKKLEENERTLAKLFKKIKIFEHSGKSDNRLKDT